MKILDKPQDLIEKIVDFPIFQGIDREVIQWVIDKSEYQHFEVGDQFFEPGEPIDNMVINVAGEWAIRLKEQGTLRNFQSIHAGTVSGLLPYSRMKAAGGYGIAVVPCEILLFHKKHFAELGTRSQDLMQALVTTMMDRVRDFTQYKNQNEKLISLGKLSAGLAHELNNPAAAMVRSAQELRKKVHSSPDKFKKVTAIRMEAKEIDAVNDILFSKIEQDYTCTLSMIERTDLEDEYLDWLEEREVDNAEDISVTFVESGISQEDLDELDNLLPTSHIGPVLGWIESTLSLERLIKDIQESANRISTLVSSVKSYSHMDRGQDNIKVDIHEGLRSTLIIMKHKLKDKQIQVMEEFPESLPEISLNVGEINQVWTNLIDNAIDAMKEGGTLQLRTRFNSLFNQIEVEIEDNGAGIPSDITNKIFDPFFTTKAVGEGTGIGLDTTQKIIKRHRGTIKVNSEPGQTTFTVCLPLAS